MTEMAVIQPPRGTHDVRRNVNNSRGSKRGSVSFCHSRHPLALVRSRMRVSLRGGAEQPKLSFIGRNKFSEVPIKEMRK